MHFMRPEHVLIGDVLHRLRSELFLSCQCWFGGGTAIVLKNEEYRRSLDIDFLCASQEGYRELRSIAQREGVRGLFGEPVSARRDIRCDQYGIRTALEFGGQTIKFEIVREARIVLAGALDAVLRCPLLSVDDQFAEKLLANADRCQDASVAYRDAFDLGILTIANGRAIPMRSIDKAIGAYGNDVWKKLDWVVSYLLGHDTQMHEAALSVQMDPTMARDAILALRDAVDEARRPGNRA